MGITPTIIDAGRWGGIYTPIENAMSRHSIDILGDQNYRTKLAAQYRAVDGEMRPASLDMSADSRCARTLMVRRLGDAEINRLHAIERRQGYFVSAIETLFKLRNYKPEVLTEDRLEVIRKFNNDNRPVARNVYGVDVPAYFPPDMEFDGMEYHHAWDMCVVLGHLILPEVGVKNKKASKLFEPVESVSY